MVCKKYLATFLVFVKTLKTLIAYQRQQNVRFCRTSKQMKLINNVITKIYIYA